MERDDQDKDGWTVLGVTYKYYGVIDDEELANDREARRSVVVAAKGL